MKRRPILVVAGLLLVAFGLGVRMGSRFGRRPVMGAANGLPAASARVPDAPAAGSPPPCLDIRNAGPREGKGGCVSGLVLRVYSARTGNTFLDFCPDYRNCPFTSVIFSSDKNKFGDVQSLAGRQIEIRGAVTVYQAKPEIVIRDPEQIRMAP